MTLKPLTKILAVASIAAFAAGSTSLSAQEMNSGNAFNIPDDVTILEGADPNNRTATAIVNGFVITDTDIEHRFALWRAANASVTNPEELKIVRAQIFRNLIDETLQIQEATNLEMPVTQAEIDQRYAALAAQNFNDGPERMDAYLLGVGSSPVSLKRQIHGEIAWQRVLRRTVTPFINVSEEEVREVIERLEASRGTEEFWLAEIYLSASTENEAAVLQNAQRILEQLQQGGSFEAYARQFSESSTAAVGGDLGYVRLETLPVAMANAARAMQPNQLQGPIQIPGGFVIIAMVNRRQVLTADPRDALLSLKQISIGFEPGTSQEDAAARVEGFGQFIENLRGCADAETASSLLGATVVTNDQIKAGDLPAQLQSIILDLQVGQTTPPFGSIEEGVRVLMLCGRDDPQVASGPTPDSIRDNIESERIQKRAQRYLRDLRNDAYVEYN
ncbi:MAG: peptidylprolyl isomerase [Pseudomonadota bacterium]